MTNVNLYLNAFDNATQPVREVIKSLDKLNEKLKIAKLSQRQFTKLAEKNFLEVSKGGELIDKLTGKTVKYGVAVKQAAFENRKFKFQWLTVMFAGMALSRVFEGMVHSMFQLTGVSDMWAATIQTTLLPTFLPLSDILFKLMNFIMNLPEPIQEMIGAFVLVGFAAGKVATAIGAIMLPISMLMGAGIGLGTIILGVISIFAGLALIVKGVIDIMKGKFEGVGLVIMGVGSILLLFIGWWALIPIAVGAAVYFIIRYWDKFKGFFVNLWNKLKNLFITVWRDISSFFIRVWDKIKSTFVGAWNFIKSVAKSTADFLISLPKKILNAFMGLGRKIARQIEDLLPSWIVKLFKGGLSLARKTKKLLLGSFQTGGIVPVTGPYLLHAGEIVIPRERASAINFSPSITINATISSDMDVRRIAEELNRRFASDFQRIVNKRGII